ncbi:MAG: DUF4846 domain-containing protein [Clostridiales bacterium]|jgi:hypothetical protein|nr:DUF4846 domain-containing protein [Clostridiales bacterium]
MRTFILSILLLLFAAACNATEATPSVTVAMESPEASATPEAPQPVDEPEEYEDESESEDILPFEFQAAASATATPAPTETPIPTPTERPMYKPDPGGMTVKDRFPAPDGFTRETPDEGSFEEFLQNLPLKPHGSKVMIFDKSEKARDVHAAVVDFILGDRDLQQCADAVMRLRAEYLFETGQAGEIGFHFVNGFYASFDKWSDGYGIKVSGNDASWVANSRNNKTYESLQQYLDIVYSYASTLSLDKELMVKPSSEVSIGDVFIRPGSPGHCVIVADRAVSKSGDAVFLIAQSFMPAQDIHILKCPQNDDGSPWYSSNFGETLVTPDWSFAREELKSWP